MNSRGSHTIVGPTSTWSLYTSFPSRPHLTYISHPLLLRYSLSTHTHWFYTPENTAIMASPRKKRPPRCDYTQLTIPCLTEQIRTTTTDLLNINHPIMLAGMNVAAGPKLAAAVTNAGGIGVIGGVGYTPDMLREQIAELKSFLKDKNAPFGVDLLIPQVGGSARKTK